MKIDISYIENKRGWVKSRFVPRSVYFYSRTEAYFKISFVVISHVESNLALLIPDLENVRIQLMRIIYNED